MMTLMLLGKRRNVCIYGYLMQNSKAGFSMPLLNVLYNEASFWIHFEPSKEVEFAPFKSMNCVFLILKIT